MLPKRIFDRRKAAAVAIAEPPAEAAVPAEQEELEDPKLRSPSSPKPRAQFKKTKGQGGKPKREQRREVSLAPAPRTVPLSVVILMAFGGGPSMIGYSILSISSVALWRWPMHSEAVTPLLFGGALGTTTGEVTSVERSGVFGSPSEHGASAGDGRRLQFAFMVSPMNAEVELMRVTFSYTVEGAGTYESRSFAPATAASLPRVGDTVPVEYVLSRPRLARIPFLAYHAYGWQVVWVLFFPLIGLALVLPRLCSIPAQVIERPARTMLLPPSHVSPCFAGAHPRPILAASSPYPKTMTR